MTRSLHYLKGSLRRGTHGRGNIIKKMMDSFLRNIATYLYGKYGDALSDCALVFPNRRAGLFFTRHLAEIIQKPLWLPRVINISDLMQTMSLLQPADPLTLNFELYRVFRRVTGNRESFDEFYSWGEILLDDFDEIDKYMADAPSLFRNVTGLKNLDEQFDYLTPEQVEAIRGFWSTFSHGERSPQQKEFLRIWEVLAEVYTQYRNHLSGKGIAYEGMIFRDVAERVERGILHRLPFQKIFIAGFNALCECENRLFDHLRREKMGEFFWDYDQYYISRQEHQAGFFMRDNLIRYPHTGFIQENLCIEKNRPVVEIISVPSNSGQAKLLAGLDGVFCDNDPARTAVVLPDESLLLPVLSSLPDEVAEINVTMGYPLRDNTVYGLVLYLISLQKNALDDGGICLFHNSDVLALLQHTDLRGTRPEVAERIIRIIRERNLVYIEEKEIDLPHVWKLVFRKARSGRAFLDYLIEIFTLIGDYPEYGADWSWDGDVSAIGDEEIEQKSAGFPVREFIFRLLTGIRRLRDILGNSDTGIRFDTMVKLLKKVLHGIRIPFYGEPLGGVQVMGVLETRALDFENVIWLSMNEGVFPSRQHSSSFIPWSLRKGHGLPGSEQHEAVFAYYFYRMLQRTRRTFLVYNTRSDGLFTGEMSRFIYQLKFDRLFRVNEKSLVSNILTPEDKPIVIGKTPDIMRVMERFVYGADGNKYLSAGALNTFMDCSLRFYFRYITRLPEPDHISGEIDMALFGTLLHRSAQLIYEPFTGKQVRAEDIDTILKGDKQIERHVGRAFSQVAGGNSHITAKGLNGMNKIISGVLVTYLREMLRHDRQISPFSIEGLEKEVRAPMEISGGSGHIILNLGGIIDRVDEVAGTVRVVDYKTGSDDPGFKNVESLFERGNSKRSRAVFQTFYYAWLYLESAHTARRISPVLYQVRKFFSREDFIVTEKLARGVQNPVLDFNLYRNDFETGLRRVMEDIFDSQTAFVQTEDSSICRYCPYNKLCHRD
jgi:hypothetical protein